MQESVLGWVKKQLCRGRIKEGPELSEGGPEKHPARTLTETLQLLPERAWEKMAARSLSHLRRCVILFLFDLVSSLLPSVSSKSFSLLLSLSFSVALFLSASLFLSFSCTQTPTKQVYGMQVWRLCKQLIPGADQMLVLWQMPHCISTFHYIINLLFHRNCLKSQALKDRFQHLIHLLFMSHDTEDSRFLDKVLLAANSVWRKNGKQLLISFRSVKFEWRLVSHPACSCNT